MGVSQNRTLYLCTLASCSVNITRRSSCSLSNSAFSVFILFTSVSIAANFSSSNLILSWLSVRALSNSALTSSVLLVGVLSPSSLY